MGDKKKNTKKSEEQNFSFQVDLRGIIRLLSENLYSSADVFLRELLQNGVDAVEAILLQRGRYSAVWRAYV